MLASNSELKRDWFGHGVQFVGILLVIGLPLVYWGNSVNVTLATITSLQSQQGKEIDEQKRVQALITNQLLDSNRELTKIGTLLDTFKDDFRSKKLR